MKNSVNRDFIAYDYLSLNVEPELEQFYVDCYQCFGYILTSASTEHINHDYFINDYNLNQTRLVNIKFKRDRKIKNKVELLVLQKEMELSLKKIDRLNKEAELLSTIYSVSIGSLGLLFIIFSILSFNASNPLYILGALCGIVGALGAISAFFVYNIVKIKTKEKNEILIEEQYAIIYDCCEKANNLIN